MPKRSKIILEVWNGSAWVPVYSSSSGNKNALINLQIKEKLGHPVMARFSLMNRPVTTSAVRGYVEQTYGAYLEEFDRIRLVESYTKAIIFYGRVYREEVKQDMSYGSLINITAFDALQELRENFLQGQAANLTSTSTVSDAITKIINNFSYNTRVGSSPGTLVSSNISVADTQKFNTSASSTAESPDFSSGNSSALAAIYKLAAKDPHSSSTSNTVPDTDFGYNYFVDSGFTSADAATTHANAKPTFNYFKRETMPAISPANHYNITYKGAASDGDSSNSYTTTTNTFSEFDFSKQYTDIITHVLLTYSKDDGTQDTVTVIKLNVSAISNGSGNDLDFGTLLEGESIEKSPDLWRRATSGGYTSVGKLIYIDNVTASGSGVALVTINDDIAVHEILGTSLSGTYDTSLYISASTPTSTAIDQFYVDSSGSTTIEHTRIKDLNYDAVEAPDDIRRALAAHFTKKTESTKPIRGYIQIPEYPMARITVDPSSINTSTNVLTLPINVLDRAVRKGMLVRQVTSAGVETGNYGYISNVTTSPDTITVQLYDSGNSTTSWSSDDKCLIFVPIRPGFRVNVTNTFANISGTGVVLDLDYSEGVGVQTTAMNIVINNTAAIYSDTPNPTQTGTTYSPNNIPSSTKPIRTTCVFSNTGTNQVNWAAGNLYVGADEYPIDAGNQGSLSTSSWSIVYWLSSDDGGDDTIFSVASSLANLPQKAVKVARIKAGDSQAQWEFFAGTTQNPQYDLGDSTIFTGNLGVDLFADGAKPFTTDVTWSGGTGTSYNQVTNSSGTLNYADGTTLSVTGPTTHDNGGLGLADNSNQYFYVDTTSGTVSATTTGSAAIGSNKILLAIAGISNSSDQATPTILPINTKTPIISATALTANAVTADKIQANAVTAGKIQANAVTAGKLEATLTVSNTIRTASSGARVEITSSGLEIINSPYSRGTNLKFTDTSGTNYGHLQASYAYSKSTLGVYAHNGASPPTLYQAANFGVGIGYSADAGFVTQGNIEIIDSSGTPTLYFTGTGSLQGRIEMVGGVLYTYDGVGTNRATIGNNIRSASGSASSPTFSFLPDTYTGMYSGGTNILAFSTAGTARWSIGTGGDLVPATDGSGGAGYDIGSSSYEVDKFYGYTIFFSNSASTTGTDLIVTASGQIAKKSSSIQYKENVKNLVFDSSKLDILRPVSYDYKLNNAPDIGLVAEEVDEVFPELVNYDKEGKPESVKYHSLSVMLLHEVTKLRKEVKELKENN